MPPVPNKRPVSIAIRSAQRALKQAVKEVNHAAADLAKKGKYEHAEAVMSKGRELLRFREEVVGLEKKWKQVCKQAPGVGKTAGEISLTAWQYYPPITRCLIALGGKASLKELEDEFLKQMEGHLQTGDHAPSSNGRERWQVMIRRARKHMVQEGWLSAGSTKFWEITASGRKLTENKTTRVGSAAS